MTNPQTTRVLKAEKTLNVVFSMPGENPGNQTARAMSGNMFPDGNMNMVWFDDSFEPISASEYQIDSSIVMENSRRNFQADQYRHSPYSEIYGRSTLYNIR